MQYYLVDLCCFDGHLAAAAGKMIVAVVTHTNVATDNAIGISPPCQFLTNQCSFELRLFMQLGN
jgi:hypothetical protein